MEVHTCQSGGGVLEAIRINMKKEFTGGIMLSAVANVEPGHG